MNFLVPAAVLLLLSLPFLISWGMRARHRRELRRLLKDGFRPDRSFVRNGIAIATNEERDVFAVSSYRRTGRASGVFKGVDIQEVTLGSAPNSQLGGQSFRLDLRSVDIPSVRIDTFGPSPGLGEMTSRLKAMAAPARPTTPEGNTAEPDAARLERAIRDLTTAVEHLASVAKSLRPATGRIQRRVATRIGR